MKNELPVLVGLSRADLECARLFERTEAIPRELDRHEADLVVQKRALEEQQARLREYGMERRVLERDADAAKARRRELELKQFQVKNNIEYQAMLREVEEMRRRASDLEDQALKVMGLEEEIQAEIRRLQELVDQEERRISGIRERLQGELAEYQRQLDAARSSRDQLVAQLPPQLRGRYERIRRSKGDMAVVGVVGGACTGCGYQLPPQRINEVHQMDRLVVCEGCGRILVWPGD